jgi:pilus assembly protein CpaB
LKRSNRLVLLIGVFLAVIAFVGIAIILGRPTEPPPGQTTVPTTLPTVIAAKDIPLGVAVTADMLTDPPQTLPIDQRKGQAFQANSQVVGLVARRPITTGAQLEAADFDTSTTGCGAVDVPAGLRAIAVQVDQVSGVGTVINTGDYVDMVVGFTGDKFPVVSLDPATKSITVVAGLNGTSVKLLIEGMQVLCRQLPPVAPPANGQAAPAPTTGTQTTPLNGQQEIVILGVIPSQAELVKFAQLDGSITLVLRSRKDFVDAAGNPVFPPPSGTAGVTLKKLTVDFAVPIPELVEAVLPAGLKR